MQSSLQIIAKPAPLAVAMPEREDSIAFLEGLTTAGRMEIRRKVEAMGMMDDLISGGAARSAAAVAVERHFSGYKGMSRSYLAAMHKIWSVGGQRPNVHGQPDGFVYSPHDWRIFLKRYTNGSRENAISNPLFTAFVRSLFAETNRIDASVNSVYNRLLDMWYAGKPVPGYGTIFEWCSREHRPVPSGGIRRKSDRPAGWSPKNISRMLPRSRAVRALVQKGEHAAHSHWGDQLLRDRSQLRPFELIALDDVRFDIKVLLKLPNGTYQPVYPLAIFAIDVATGLILAKAVVGQYTRYRDMDGGPLGTKRGIQQADTAFLLSCMLEQYGVPADWPMHILAENAAASLSEADKQLFTSMLGIQFETTGLVHRKLTASGFMEQGGMPWSKGWIEAFFRGMHTRINHLKGTTGNRYDNTHGSHDALVRHTMRLIETARSRNIPVSELALPLYQLDEFHAILDEYIARLNNRVAHRLQGFCKVVECELQPGEFLRVDTPGAADIIPVGAEIRHRMESPTERFVRLMSGHTMRQVPRDYLFTLRMDRRVITVRNEQVSWIDTDISSDPLIFRDEASREALRAYNSCKKALIGFLSSDRSQVHLFTNDDKHQYVASPSLVRRVDIADEHAILKRAGEVDRSRNLDRTYAAELLAPREAEYAAMREHNARVLGTDRQEPTIADTIEAAETIARASSVRSRKTRQASTSLDASALLDDDEADYEAPAPYTTAPSFNGEDLL